MKTFPTYERRVGLQGGPTASYANPGAFKVSDAVGRAMEGLGKSIQNVGDKLAADQERIQNSQDDVWFSKARAETAQAMVAFDNQARLEANDDGAGYQERVLGHYNELRQKHMEGAPSDRARQMYEEWGYSYETQVHGSTATFRAESELAKRDADFGAAINAHRQTVLADPSQYDAVHKRAMDDLEGAKQWMTPKKEAEWRKAIESGLQSDRVEALIKADPEAALRDMGVSGGDLAGRIIGVESGGRADAKNPLSSATGAGQFIDSTWLAMVKKHRPDIWGSSNRAEILAMRNDPALSRAMVNAYAKDNAEYLGARGVGASDDNLYLAHFLGPQGALSVIKANGSTSVASLLPASVISANKSVLEGKTAGQVRAWAGRKMNASPAPNVAGNPYYSALTPDDLLSLHAKADRASAQNAAVVRQQFDDYTAYVRDGGAPRNDVAAGLLSKMGSGQVSQASEQLARAETYGADVRAAKWASPGEVSDLIAKRAATLESADDYKANRADVDGLVKIVSERNKQIAADPAGYVMQDDNVRQSFAAMRELMASHGADPHALRAAVTRYAAASIALQERLGVPPADIRLLDKAQGAQLASTFSHQPEGGQNAARLVAGLRAQWGEHWPRIFQQLVEDGKLPGVIQAIAMMDKPSQMAAAERIAEMAALGKTEAEKPFEAAQKADLKDAVAGEFADFGQTLANNVGGVNTYAAVHDAAYLLGLRYMQEGSGASDAASRAFKDIVGEKYNIRASFRVPVEYDADAVLAGAGNYLAQLDELAIDPDKSAIGLDEDGARAATIAQMKAQGLWVTAPDESGLALIDGTTRAMVTVGGAPLIVPWEQLVARAGADPIATTAPDAVVTP